MKSMKKILVLVLVLGLAISAAACGNGKNSKISVISREAGSGTRGAFVELMGVEVDGEDHTVATAEVSQSTSVVMSTVSGNANAIGYISLGSLNDSVKALSVDGVKAGVEEIKTSQYPISRPFLVIPKAGISQLGKDFIEYILSAEGQAIVESEGYISVNDHATNYKEKDGLKGKIVLAGSTSVSPVMQILADAYKSIYPEAEIEIQQTGSGAGITSTIEGVCDIGMSSRALKPEEESQGISGQEIALDGIAVVVNNENTVEELSSEQIKQIFIGEITDWSEVSE